MERHERGCPLEILIYFDPKFPISRKWRSLWWARAVADLAGDAGVRELLAHALHELGV